MEIIKMCQRVRIQVTEDSGIFGPPAIVIDGTATDHDVYVRIILNALIGHYGQGVTLGACGSPKDMNGDTLRSESTEMFYGVAYVPKLEKPVAWIAFLSEWRDIRYPAENINATP